MQLISNISIKLHREYPREEDFRSKNEKGFDTVRDYKGNLFNNLEIIFFNIKLKRNRGIHHLREISVYKGKVGICA